MNRSRKIDDDGDEGGRHGRERRMRTMVRVRRDGCLPPSGLPADEGECDEGEGVDVRVDGRGRHR